MEQYYEAVNSLCDQINQIVDSKGVDNARSEVEELLNNLQRSLYLGHLPYEGLSFMLHTQAHAAATRFAVKIFGSNKKQFLMRMSQDIRVKLEVMSESSGQSMAQVVESLIRAVDLDPSSGGRDVV